jgi:hypothetical protein
VTYSIIRDGGRWAVTHGESIIERFDDITIAGERCAGLSRSAEAALAARTAFRLRLNAVSHAFELARNELLTLPVLSAATHCGCDDEALVVVTPGWEQWCRVTVETDYCLDDDGFEQGDPVIFLHASTDGWDDMGDDGAFTYILCSAERGGCGATWQPPEDMEWN